AAAAQGAQHRTSPGFLKILIIPEALLLEMGSTEVPLPVAVPSPEITAVNEGSAPAAPSTDSKPKKKICCACPDTKRLRDECIVEHGNLLARNGSKLTSDASVLRGLMSNSSLVC
ncbi:unnamed protein product, partial [Urochloa humidicola]